MLNEADKIILDQIHERLSRIEEKIDLMQEFKAATIVSARFTSFVVSGILGFVSLVSSSVLTYVITTKIMQR